MMELRHFRAFREVCNTRSFSRAAKNLQVTPSAVSRSISELERKLGTSLINRKVGNITPTPEGIHYLSMIAGALETLEIASLGLEDMSGAVQGAVRIGVPSMYARKIILPEVGKFLKRHPGLHIEFVICDGDHEPIEQRLDLWLQFDKPESDNYKIKVIYTPPVRMVASPEYLLANARLECLEDLRDHTCLLPHNPNLLEWSFLDRSGGTEVRMDHIQRPVGNIVIGGHIDILYDAARAGLGIMAADVGMIIDDLQARRLQIVLPRFSVCGSTVWSKHLSLFYDRRRILSRRVEIVKDFLVQLARNLTNQVQAIDELVMRSGSEPA